MKNKKNKKNKKKNKRARVNPNVIEDLFVGKSGKELSKMPLFKSAYEKASKALLYMIAEFGSNEVLTPYDIFSLSKTMGIKTSEFCEKYADMYVSFGGRIPLAKIKTEYKNTSVVSTWLTTKGKVDNYVGEFQHFISRIIDHMIVIEEQKLTDQELADIIATLVSTFYCAYETDNDFYPQFQRNVNFTYMYLEDIVVNHNLEDIIKANK